MKKEKFEFVTRLGDNCLVLGHRLSEWCGHGPVLEQDIAMTNIALDLIGQARLYLDYAGKIEEKGRDEDALAYRRDAMHYRNFLLVEQPNGDFAETIARQFYFDAWHYPYLQGLVSCKDETLGEIAEKSLKEVTYHLRWSSEWVIRLGDGTEESHVRMQKAIDKLYPYTGELFELDDIDKSMKPLGVEVDSISLQAQWTERTKAILEEATLQMPADQWMQSGGRRGVHSEHLGYILSDMQFLQRAYPDATW